MKVFSQYDQIRDYGLYWKNMEKALLYLLPQTIQYGKLKSDSASFQNRNVITEFQSNKRGGNAEVLQTEN